MKHAAKILGLAILAMVVTDSAHAADLLKATPGRTYSQIRDCLKGLTLTLHEGEDFRSKPESSDKEGVIQFRSGFWDAPINRGSKKQIDRCIYGR